MSDELKACPFCGAAGAETVFDAVVLCAGCSSEAQPGDWNRRTVTREQVEAMARHAWQPAGAVPRRYVEQVADMLSAAGFEAAE